MCRKWNATGAMPEGRAFSCSSLRFPHQRSRSSWANSKACRTARCTGGTSFKVPRNQGSGCSFLLKQEHYTAMDGKDAKEKPSQKNAGLGAEAAESGHAPSK